jgi:hypothetical protein
VKTRYSFEVTVERPAEADPQECQELMAGLIYARIKAITPDDLWSVHATSYTTAEYEDETRPAAEDAGDVAQPIETRPDQQFVESIERSGRGLERANLLHIDARAMFDFSDYGRPQQKAPRFARCGNCRQRFRISDDPIENHHAAMRHKDVCPVSPVDIERDHMQLIAEHAEQLQIAAAAPRLITDGFRPTRSNAPRKWWQFWLWFNR